MVGPTLKWACDSDKGPTTRVKGAPGRFLETNRDWGTSKAVKLLLAGRAAFCLTVPQPTGVLKSYLHSVQSGPLPLALPPSCHPKTGFWLGGP